MTEMEKISLVDVHAHLDDLDDLAEALQEAKIEGVNPVRNSSGALFLTG
jgi:hypothetical protein